MNFLFVILMTTTFAVTVNASNKNLRIEMYSFDNQYGIKADRRCCFDENTKNDVKCTTKCLTFFRFCLKLKATEECISEFETQVIGQNVIQKDEFNQTTDIIEFPFSSGQLRSNQLILVIEVYNDKSLFGQQHYQQQQDKLKQLAPGRELISKWILNLNNTKDNEVNLFDYKNQYLNQQLVFSYKFECSTNYYGVDCLLPICSSGCNLEKGGFCTKPNECVCKQGWTGRNCDIELNNKCTLECQNGAQCVHDKINKKQFCDCDKEIFTGVLCEVKVVKTCNSTFMCLNGGTCLNNGKCVCAPGYNGGRCEVKSTQQNQCGDKICFNGATCLINNENNYECQCKKFFTGLQCETSLNLCETQNPCKLNSDCIWNSNDLSYKCVQRSMFSSMIGNIVDRSQEATTTTAAAPTSSSLGANEIIMILALGVTLPILLILILLLVIRIYGNRRLNEKLQVLSSGMSASIPSTSTSDDNNNKQLAVQSKFEFESKKKQTVFDVESSSSSSSPVSSVNSEDTFIRNNIFNQHKNDKVICKNNIQESLSKTSSSIQQQQCIVTYNNMMASIV